MAESNFWNTLATNDVETARAFYGALGFAIDDIPGGAGITVRPNASALICLFKRDAFRGMIPGAACDPAQSQEIIQSISTETREGVDEFATKVRRAGGRVIGEPKDEPWGYGFGFADPDGHVWSVLWLSG
jgi:uncharacterized protein